MTQSKWEASRSVMPLILRIKSTGNETEEKYTFFGFGSRSNAGGIDAISVIDTRLIPKENFVEKKRSTARSLLKFAGTYIGDDFEKRLKEVYAARSKARF